MPAISPSEIHFARHIICHPTSLNCQSSPPVCQPTAFFVNPPINAVSRIPPSPPLDIHIISPRDVIVLSRARLSPSPTSRELLRQVQSQAFSSASCGSLPSGSLTFHALPICQYHTDFLSNYSSAIMQNDQTLASVLRYYPFEDADLIGHLPGQHWYNQQFGLLTRMPYRQEL
jgi:hypothetical protein